MRQYFLILVLAGIMSGCNKQDKNTSTSSALYPAKLEFGQYNVGFTTLWSHDKTRSAVPYSDWNGKLYPIDEKGGRQLQINIFYPAANDLRGESALLKQFFELSYRQVDFDVQQSDLEFAKEELKNKLIDLGGLDTLSRSDYEKLGSLQCIAVENAIPVDGKLPVILFPNGTSPISNSVTAEYLASHGFAVALFSVLGAESSTIDTSAEGIEVAVQDIAFVLNQLAELPYIDMDNVGLIGNAIESSFCAAYLARNKKVKAFVSLEGGFISHFEQSLLKQLPSYKPSAITVPILLIYSPHSSINPDYIRQLKYSKRYFAHLPGMREFDYLNFGLLDSIIPGIIGETRGNVREGYSAANDLIRSYFMAAFKKDFEEFGLILRSQDTAVVDTSFVWQEIPSLPSMTVIKDGFIKNGIPYIDSVYILQKSFEETPLSDDFITDFKNWVSWKKDPDFSARKWLYQKAVEDYPISSLYSYNLARYSLNAGDTLLATIQFKSALEKLTDDPDELLTENDKKAIRTNSLKALEDLN